MVIDSSALIAIFGDEPERPDFNRQIAAASRRLISAASVLETSIVLENRFGEEAYRELDFFLLKAAIQIYPFDAEQLEIARRAYRQYGKGRHRAGLNYGDCFSYALAKHTGEPLLFKGNDFSQTDIDCC
ncbi:type II toxin-antitoxin system VapC family toxin [Myxosarcina sp. GI1]|uniref:type II toxin-antitoxin system VapC family toxin n=1 Tax=Myxosarcina sp. GI1 TaxID=1541065 RepID=UPI00056118AC